MVENEIPPIPVPNYAALKLPTVIVKRNRSSYRVLNLRGISVDSTTEDIYVTDMENMRIQMLSQTGERIRHFGYAHLKNPWGILVHQDNVYVTDVILHAIIRFRLTDLKMMKRVGKKGSGREGFHFLPSQPDKQCFLRV